MSSTVVQTILVFVAEFRNFLKQMENCDYMLLLFNNIEATTSFLISCSASRAFSPTNIITPKLKSCMTLTSKCPKNQILFLNL